MTAGFLLFVRFSGPWVLIPDCFGEFDVAAVVVRKEKEKK